MKLMHGDCLELMKEIPDGSVDLVLTNPPYGTMKNAGKGSDYVNLACKWDDVIPIADMFDSVSRVLRPNGKCVLFSQEPLTSTMVTQAIPSMPLSYRAIWVKNVAGHSLGCKKAMVSLFEDICVFSKIAPKHDFEGKNPLREWFKQEKEKCGDIDFRKVLGNGMASHYFTNGAQFALPTLENFRKLQTTGHFKADYEELKHINDEFQKENISRMNDECPSTFNLWQGGKSKSNVLEYPKDRDHYHPTQKPVALLEDLIQTFSNPGDTVLDFTMGSGSTGVACVNTGRDFIGIELDDGYFEIARKRIEDAQRERESKLV